MVKTLGFRTICSMLAGLLITLLTISVILLSGCVYEPLETDLNTQNIYPIATNTYQIGNATLQYDQVFSRQIYLNGVLLVPGIGLEVDPVFTASPAFGITAADIINWDAAFGWGNHALAGYLTFETDPVWTASDAFVIETANITAWNSCNSSQWITDVSGINYIGSVGIHTTSSATGLLALYSSDGISNDPILSVMDNSASVESVGIRVNIAGAKTDYTDGIYITNIATTATAGADKYGLRIKNSGNWLGVGSVNYGLYIETPVGGTTNYSIYSEGAANYLGGTLTLGNVLDMTTHQIINSGSISITAGSLEMSQIGVEPSSTANRAGIYAIDLSADNCTIGFFTEQAVETALGIASENRMPIRWNGQTYYLLAENSTFRTPIVNTVRPTVGQGLQVGIVFYNLTTAIWEKCTSISPVTWEALPSGGATTWGSISGNITQQIDLQGALDSKLSTVTGTALDNVFSSNGLLKRTGTGTYTVDSSDYLTSAFAGSNNITTVGTIGTGTWSADAIADNKIASALTGKTYNALTLQANAIGFQISGGTSSKTLTVTGDATISGTPMSSALTSAHIFVGNGSGIATDVAASQDVSLVNTGAFTVTGIQTKAIPSLSAGFLKYSGSAWGFDSSTYLTGNQNITIIGDTTGSGATSISTNVSGIGGKALPALSAGLLRYSGSVFSYDSASYLTSNQNITLSGDLSGSGTTSISGNVTGIQGKAISLATGFLKYSGSAWTFDSSTYITSGVTTLSSLASIGTITTGTWNGTAILGQFGGTGVANTGKTITLGGNLATSGAFATTLTMTAATTLTLPVNGIVLSDNSTATLTNKTWNGALIAGQYGGTGIANTGRTITLNGDLTIPTLATGYLYYSGSAWAFQTPAGGTHYLLDGSTHLDTTAGTVARGDVITGQGSTPKWTKLLKGTANQVLSMDATGTDVVWATPAGGSNPFWYGKFYAASADCNPITQTQHQNMLAVSGPTPTGIGITIGRCVQFTPPANITVASIRLFGTGATTNLYKFAIYPVGTGSAKTWDSGTVTTAANTWLNLTTGLPITLTAGTRYWWCVTAVATGTTAGFRSEAAPLGTNFWGAAAAPIGNSTGLGLPVYAQFTVTSPRVFPATLPAIAAAAYSGGTTGSIPFSYLDYGGSK